MINIKENINSKLRGLLFIITRYVVMKYFPEGIEPVMGSGPSKYRIIAYRWSFYEPEYEKERTALSRRSRLSPFPPSATDILFPHAGDPGTGEPH